MLYTLAAIIVFFAVAAILLSRYEQDILGALKRNLNEGIDGELSIGSNQFTIFHQFPNLSISLRNVRLSGTENNNNQPPVLVAGRIDINVSPFQLFSNNLVIKSIDIEDGEVVVLRTRGYSNLDIFTKQGDTTQTAGRVLLDLKQIRINDLRVQLIDSVKGKFLDLRLLRTINQAKGLDSSIFFHMGGDLFVYGLTLNANEGTFLRDKQIFADLNFVLDRRHGEIILSPSTLHFSSGSVEAEGRIQPGQHTLLRIKANPIGYDEALTILNDTLAANLQRYHVDDKVNVEVTIDQRAPKTVPLVDLMFSFDSSAARASKVNMTGMTIAGSYTNHNDTSLAPAANNSSIQFSTMRGVINNIPMSGEVTITNFDDPGLDLKATVDTPLTRLNESLDTTRYMLLAGHFNSSFIYSGKLLEYLDETKTNYDGKLSGEATIKNGKFHYLSRDMVVDGVDARFLFNEKQFAITKLNLILNKSSISIEGSINEFIPFFTVANDKAKVNLNIKSPRLDITGVIKPRRATRSSADKSTSRKQISKLVEALSRSVAFDVRFSIKEFVNGTFRARDANGALLMANDRFVIRKANLSFGQGKVTMDLNVRNLDGEISPFELKASLHEVEMKEFFHAFKDFHQKTLRERHVAGKLSMDIHLSAAINDNLSVLSDRLSGGATFSVVDASLTEFEPLQRLSNYLFKNRDYSNVQFGKIFSTISLDKTRVKIERMEVQSTALSMFIEGTYDLRDSTDLSIQIPLSNIRKRDQNIPPENIGTDAKVGPSVFLRVHPDKAGKTEISYDPFKKLRKKDR
jgi:hypothetical protein